jgi:hypothetical protein
MTVTLDFPPNVETFIIQEAKREKTSVADYLTRHISETVSAKEAERQRKIALLDQLLEIGDEEEQRETFEVLKKAINEDRFSDRKRSK